MCGKMQESPVVVILYGICDSQGKITTMQYVSVEKRGLRYNHRDLQKLFIKKKIAIFGERLKVSREHQNQSQHTLTMQTTIADLFCDKFKAFTLVSNMTKMI